MSYALLYLRGHNKGKRMRSSCLPRDLFEKLITWSRGGEEGARTAGVISKVNLGFRKQRRKILLTVGKIGFNYSTAKGTCTHNVAAFCVQAFELLYSVRFVASYWRLFIAFNVRQTIFTLSTLPREELIHYFSWSICKACCKIVNSIKHT